MAANFGRTGRTFSQANFNYDGVVDTLDFNTLAAQFGKSLPPSAMSAAVPVGFSSHPIRDAGLMRLLSDSDRIDDLL
jgi:hypothetical protein